MGSTERRRIVDLSHVITAATRTAPELPAPNIAEFLTFEDSHASYAWGTEFSIGAISMVGCTGTHVDTPAHRYRGGDDLTSVTLDRLLDLPGCTILTGAQDVIDADLLDGIDVAGRAVLFATGHDRWWGTDLYFLDHPHLTRAAAEALADRGAALVGIDSPDVDRVDTDIRPVQSTLLGAGIPIVKHLRGLTGLPRSGFRFGAPPPMVAGLSSFPVRAHAIVAAH